MDGISKSFGKTLRFNGNFNFYRAVTSGEYLGVDYSADTYTWSSRLTAKVKLPKKTSNLNQIFKMDNNKIRRSKAHQNCKDCLRYTR